MPEAAKDGRPVEIEVRGETSGKAVDLKWKLSPQPSNPDNAYLAKLVATARRDGALSLPTVGAAGLAELRSLVNGEAAQLAKLGQQALVLGEIDQAERLAREAAQLDPLNAQAEILQTAARKAQRAERANDETESADAARATQVSLRRAAAAGEPLAATEPEDGQLLDEVERQRRVYAQFLRSEVRYTVNAARGMMGVDPEGAINTLKLLLEKVTQAPELEPEVRAQLRDQIEAALQTASQQAIIKTERDMRREEIAAEEQARQRINRELFLQEQKVDQLMARFNALMDEERYRDAEAVANIAEEMSPNTPGLRDAELTARMVGYTADMMAVVDARHRGVIDSLYQIELSLVPTPDEPPILYPDPEVWQLLTERRKKYKAVDLTESNPNEAKIVAALDDKTELEFVDQPLSDVVDYLKERHEIEIQLDSKALTDEGIGSDTPVTRNIKGITLRSALRLMLGEMDLTYVIRNEVLMITTKTEAENMLSIKVYPVGDLVIPVGLRMGGGGGGGMGGMGMGGMGMGGGF
jgi:tetratricopeptide (TPR) repeat protein